MRAVVTLNEEYETRFLCCSAQVSPGAAGGPQGLLSVRPSRRWRGFSRDSDNEDVASSYLSQLLTLCEKLVKSEDGREVLELQRRRGNGSIESPCTSLCTYKNTFCLGMRSQLPSFPSAEPHLFSSL